MDNFWLGVAIAAIAFGVISLFVDDAIDFIGGCVVGLFFLCLIGSVFSGAVILFKLAFLGGWL